MNKGSCEAEPLIEARRYYQEGMAACKKAGGVVIATNSFLTGAPLAEKAVSIPTYTLGQKAELIELAVAMHFLAGNYEDALAIGQNSLRGMERFPERKNRIVTLMERARNPEVCERDLFHLIRDLTVLTS